MSIWVDRETRVIVQGITGSYAATHTQLMLKYGTQIVGGVTPGKGGTKVEGVSVFDTVEKAVKETGANASVIYVPAPFAVDALLEAIDADLPLIVCITEYIPVLDMAKIKKYITNKKTRVIGPNCPGIITPGECKIGIMPGHIHQKGHIGIVSRSGTLTYEAVNAVSEAGLGQSTAIGIGGDPIKGIGFIDVLKAFNQDEETEAVIMIGEIGGNEEEKAAEWIQAEMDKPVIAYIGGKIAPTGKRMGHAGAIISGGQGTAQNKIVTLEASGIKVANTLTELVPKLKSSLKG